MAEVLELEAWLQQIPGATSEIFWEEEPGKDWTERLLWLFVGSGFYFTHSEGSVTARSWKRTFGVPLPGVSEPRLYSAELSAPGQKKER